MGIWLLNFEYITLFIGPADPDKKTNENLLYILIKEHFVISDQKQLLKAQCLKTYRWGLFSSFHARMMLFKGAIKILSVSQISC